MTEGINIFLSSTEPEKWSLQWRHNDDIIMTPKGCTAHIIRAVWTFDACWYIYDIKNIFKKNLLIKKKHNGKYSLQNGGRFFSLRFDRIVQATAFKATG